MSEELRYLGYTRPMKSRVFLSCGQRPKENDTARKLKALLERRGFDVYVAIDVQTLLEINERIIRELKNSDYYLFVNFQREHLGRSVKCRGSLFSNQELAIAYSLGFEHILVVNQDGVEPEGVLRYIGINTEKFSGFTDCCAVVERALDRSAWRSDYSRRLRAGDLHFRNESIMYSHLFGRFLYLDVKNDRPDIAALETTARLAELRENGNAFVPTPIRSPLKASGRPGFSHTIFPRSYETFDLLCVGNCTLPMDATVIFPPATGAPISAPPRKNLGVYLNTALDVAGAPDLHLFPGVWTLRYEFFAIDFPVLSVLIELTLTDTPETTTARIIGQETL